MALSPPSQQTFGVVSSPRASSSTALSMNIFDRFSRVAKSNLNNILKSLEDPEKIMNQAVEDMQVSHKESCAVVRFSFRT